MKTPKAEGGYIAQRKMKGILYIQFHKLVFIHIFIRSCFAFLHCGASLRSLSNEMKSVIQEVADSNNGVQLQYSRFVDLVRQIGTAIASSSPDRYTGSSPALNEIRILDFYNS